MNFSHYNKLIAIALAVAAIGTTQATELRLANGDILSGEVVSHEGGKIRFASPVLGTIELDDSVATILPEVAHPATKAPHVSGEPKPVTDGNTRHASRGHDIDPKEMPWKSKIDVGMNWQDGRKDQQDVSLRFESERKANRNQYRLQARYLYSESTGVTTTERKDAGIRWRRDLNERWFSQSNTSYFDDQIKQIDLNVDQNVGVGYKVFTGDHAIANVGAGVTLQYRESIDVSNAFNPFGELFQDLKWRLSDRVEISQEAGALYSPDGRTLQPTASSPDKYSDQASYKLMFHSVIRGQLTESVSVNLRYEYEFDNSIVDRAARTDQRVTTSLGYVF